MYIIYPDFDKIEIRTGKIIEAEDFPKANKPAYKLKIDFGPLGIKKSSAQITKNYTKESLLNKQVVAVVNFPPKKIADFTSEVLVLGLNDGNQNVSLISPDHDIPLGERVY